MLYFSQSSLTYGPHKHLTATTMPDTRNKKEISVMEGIDFAASIARMNIWQPEVKL